MQGQPQSTPTAAGATVDPGRVRLLLATGWLAHLGGAGLALVYNLIIRSTLHQERSELIIRAAKSYIVVTSLLGAVAGAILVRRLKVYVAEQNRETLPRSVLWFPVARALISTASWLLSIPVLASVTIHVNGHVHPVGFPHFVASILIAWLVSTIYSSICNLWLALYISRPAFLADGLLMRDARIQARLACLKLFASALPGLAASVPLVAGIMYLLFVQPVRQAAGHGKALELFLVVLMTLGGYGCYLCRWTADKMLALMPK